MLQEVVSTQHALYHDRAGVQENFSAGTWQNSAFADFSQRIEGRSSPFPCHFGTAGFRKNELRFFYSEDGNVSSIAHALEHYVKTCRAFGSNTSFVVTLKTDEVLSVEKYHQVFWNLLSGLAKNDQAPWPNDIPVEVENSAWEFCFAGEALFVVCTTPAHMHRQSRYSPHFSMLFQPRWVFANILDTPEKAKKAFNSVRVLLKDYDDAALSPYLGMYGNPDNREHLQYFLSDDKTPLGCPFKSMRETRPALIPAGVLKVGVVADAGSDNKAAPVFQDSGDIKRSVSE
ncbi:YqcI/YcgG family protein [Undibacterium sp. JH2W]|uniref:YqcI/YcgG family protein n=1 Tax=Undibacterium sp. JH2W TaxID=3413037 RepID=UPI003BEF76FB